MHSSDSSVTTVSTGKCIPNGKGLSPAAKTSSLCLPTTLPPTQVVPNKHLLRIDGIALRDKRLDVKKKFLKLEIPGNLNLADSFRKLKSEPYQKYDFTSRINMLYRWRENLYNRSGMNDEQLDVE
ncbi:hypothetical protein CEXT_301001 [Caerostris extrusa]|uniref:Uncharacterized protein n=1 Tax=Caerostris extrusa TaxID=172846 RepID=A0AAV4MRW6_CAEEX|nr:hypothetical protein CEXT_301001 [Caerostris extrusa]